MNEEKPRLNPELEKLARLDGIEGLKVEQEQGRFKRFVLRFGERVASTAVAKMIISIFF